jgi:hypothetical protein
MEDAGEVAVAQDRSVAGGHGPIMHERDGDPAGRARPTAAPRMIGT